MVSSAEQLAANMSWSVFSKATDLKKRILFTLFALMVYRLGTYIPIPGIDPHSLSDFFSQNFGGILGMFDMFSGGALGRMTIFALNLMPYISASIIVQLMSSVSPQMEALKKEGESGRKKLNQWTRYLTVFIAFIQAWGMSVGLERMTSSVGPIVTDPGLFFRFTTAITLVGGTVFLMWLGEQITQRGIGNGISLIIFAGIVANLPSALVGTLELGRTGALSAGIIIAIIFFSVLVIGGIVFVERAQRRILIQYPKRQMGHQIMSGESTHLPLKINTAGVIPPIFASALLLLPLTLAQFMNESGPEWLTSITTLLSHGQPLYISFYVLGIVFFSFFYTSVVFNPQDTADNLKKNGGFVSGVRPGKNTAEHLDFILTRLTVLGAIYLSIVCIIPELLMGRFSVPFYFGGTSLLIVVSVTLDTVSQIQSHLLAHQYEGLIKKSRLRGKQKSR